MSTSQNSYSLTANAFFWPSIVAIRTNANNNNDINKIKMLVIPA